jgi:hypothetical protein
MFRFLFKRAPKRDSAQPASPVPETISAPDRAALQREAREAAIARADALAGDEAAAVAFILESEHADARLKAAGHLQSREHLERVRDAMRNTDRRVAKLMQQRLEQQARSEALAARATAAAERAERLAAAPQPMVNQVAELDRDWAALNDAPGAIRERFDASRARLAQRLQDQAALQRAVLDELATLEGLREASSEMPEEEAERQLAEAGARMAAHLQSAEAPSLPKARLQAFDEGVRALRASLEERARRSVAEAARAAALESWEKLAEADPQQLAEADIRREWDALPALAADDAAPLRARFDALLARLRAAQKPREAEKPAPARPAARPEPDRAQGRLFEDALTALEAALEEGALHAAADQDRALRALDLKVIRPGDAQLARLSRLRAELARLQGWARWGGSVSREELLKAAEDLQGQDIPLAELAKRLGSLRARWKELDAASGAAGREAWQRFDAACTAAHAPVAAHYQALADERRQNLERARAVVAETRDFAQASGAAADGADVDWKTVAAFCSRVSQLWRRLGPIDRRERKAIDAEFADALRALTEPLAAQQRHEIARRESLIAEVEALDANSPRSVDALRAIQERWQEMARMLPLERGDEQALWQRFRQACDALFAERREAAKVADAERQDNLERKQALCAALEAAAQAPVSTLAQLLRETAEAWRGIGPVPRAAQQALEERHAAATEALARRIEAERGQRLAQRARALLDKLSLCRQAESALAVGGHPDASLRAAWEALPSAPDRAERALRTRFDADLSANAADAPARAALERNRPAVLADLLALEVHLGIDSPPELAQQRLQLQVQALQSSLKSGQSREHPQELLQRICALPALLDDADFARLERVAPLALPEK